MEDFVHSICIHNSSSVVCITHIRAFGVRENKSTSLTQISDDEHVFVGADGEPPFIRDPYAVAEFVAADEYVADGWRPGHHYLERSGTRCQVTRTTRRS